MTEKDIPLTEAVYYILLAVRMGMGSSRRWSS